MEKVYSIGKLLRKPQKEKKNLQKVILKRKLLAIFNAINIEFCSKICKQYYRASLLVN